MYSLMNYGDIKLGTWYPRVEICKVVEGMVTLHYLIPWCNVEYNAEVTSISAAGSSVIKLKP